MSASVTIETVRTGARSNRFVVAFVVLMVGAFFNRLTAQETTTSAPVNPPNPPAETTVSQGSPAPVIAYLGDMCVTKTQCQVANSDCAPAGDNSGTQRCRCIVNYFSYDSKNSSKKEDLKCGKIVSSATHPDCKQCEDNEGTCILQDDGTTSFCQCPISRSGKNCETIHVNVSCNTTVMKVCYSPHFDVSFADGWKMYTAGRSNIPQCVGSNVTTSGGTCGVGNEELSLSLNNTDMKTCGTTVIENSHNKRFMNVIEIQQFDTLGKETNSTPKVFNVYCSFTAYEDQTFSGMGVGRVNGNDRGTQVTPNITFKVTDQFDRLIGGGVTLLVGDLIKFVITLVLDGNYESMQVLRCTASTSPVIPDSSAETRALINAGCPIKEEATGPSWYWTKSIASGRFNLTSGNVPIFKLSSSNYVYFHCALKLCMVGDNSCPLYTKAECESPKRKKRDEDLALESLQFRLRRKRAAENLDLTTGVKVSDPNSSAQKEQSNGGPLAVGSPGFIALLVILAIIALVLVIVTTIFAVPAIRKQGTGDGGQYRPQLFALPRISRTHERF